MRRLDCEEMRLLLDAFEDNELDGVTSLEVQQHLDECDECRALRFWHSEARASLRRIRAATPGAPASLRALVSARMRVPAAMRWWRAAAAAAVLLAAILAWQLRPARAAAPMEFVRNHVSSLGKSDRVRFVTTDAAQAEAWLRGRLPFQIHLPRNPPEGYRLAGARLCSVGGNKVAYVLYDPDAAGSPVSLFIGPAGACRPDELAPVQTAGVALRRGECDGTMVAAWDASGSSYVLAGGISEPSLLAYTAQEADR